MYHPHHFLSQIKQMNQRTSVPAFLQSGHAAMRIWYEYGKEFHSIK